MAKGKVVQEVKGKVEDKKGLNPVQEEGLRRAFTRKAILSPRYSFWMVFYMMLNLMIFLREQEGLARLLLVSEDKVGH